MQCFLGVSLSLASGRPGAFWDRGRGWPKKKPSGSESEEEEQVEQGASSLGSRGICSRSCPDFEGPSAPTWHCGSSGQDPSSPCWASRLELATRKGVSWLLKASSEVPSLRLLPSGPASPGEGQVRNAHPWD